MTDNSSAKSRPAPAERPVARTKLPSYPPAKAKLNERVTVRKPKTKAREVEVVSSDYQPSAAELEEDVRVDATFDQAVEALTKPVSIRYVSRPKPTE
ncbi:MAG: hypothetical protein OXO52_02685 [Rhodospirillales bacterium]|nr:hypothetical protein [Rhodospirillales bacterium]MDE0378572.1 hypothetical protein [Rhodospirillales bacterium]